MAEREVPPGDLLAVGKAPSHVLDRDLVDDDPHPEKLRGDLRFDAEAVRRNIDVGEHASSNQLVAGLHVGQGRPEQRIRDAVSSRLPSRWRSVIAGRPRANRDP